MMEYQRKARRKQLCILIYNILLIYLCSCKLTAAPVATASHIPSSSSQPSSALPTSSSSTSSSSSSSSSSLLLARTAATPSIQSSTNQTTARLPSIFSLPQQQAAATEILPKPSASLSPPLASSSSPLSPTSASPTSASNIIINNNNYDIDNPVGPKKVCPGVHIRNDLKSFEQLRGCDVVDGPLTIALVSNLTHKDYENITFPQLKEITEYLLFFRVEGLTTLSQLFPNLAVIRGRELVSNYALIIYEMMHLQKIYLPNLSDILRGSVRIESNPNLCYVSTVNWEGICQQPFTPHFIRDNNRECNNRCPNSCQQWNTTKSDRSVGVTGDVAELGATNNRALFCWNNQVCHQPCKDDYGIYQSRPRAPNGKCCAPQCAGGCYQENNSLKCVACRSVSEGDKCVEFCNSNMFEYKGQCIDEETCLNTKETVQQNTCSKTGDSVTISNLKTVKKYGAKHGHCQANCLAGYEEDSENKHKCKPCDKGTCRKICTPPQGSDKPFMVTNVNNLREISGCNVINGSLDISLKGGKNVMHELESAFQNLEEIRGYLKITRSYPILTLGFLRNLRSINGSELDRGHYSLIIIDNPNLQELFMFEQNDSAHKPLTIANGTIFVHLNQKLCLHRITNLKNYATVAPWNDHDVSRHTNGDKEACETTKLDVQVVRSTSTLTVVKIENFASKMQDPRTLLYYLINYREVAEGSVTIFDGRDGCNSANDLWITIEEAPTDIFSKTPNPYQEVILKVKAATRYALYVKTFTILAEAHGAMSDIMYFETAPDTPDQPRQIESISTDPNSAEISWLPPAKPNGIIEGYRIFITRDKELGDFGNIDNCDLIASSRDVFTRAITQEERKQSAFQIDLNQRNTSTDTSAANTCSNMAAHTDPDIQAEVVTFQDMIIDIVYLRSPCPTASTSKTTVKRKRSISNGQPHNFGDGNPNTASQNTIPRESNTHDSADQSAQSNQSDLNNSSSMVDFNETSGKTEAYLTVAEVKPDGRFTYRVTGLKHYSLYKIEVVACHGEFISSKSKPSKTYSKCGLAAVRQVRTQAKPENDMVLNSTIKFIPANETSPNTIRWDSPEDPNGLILAYRLRYKLKGSSSDIQTDVCINSTFYNYSGGFVLSDISPGTYLLKIQTVSQYTLVFGSQNWSAEIEFDIPQDYFMSPTVLILLILFGILVLVVSVAVGTFVYQKQKQILDYASINPDYVQYDPDEYEVDKSNLIIQNQVGVGSFGLVFKGQLVTEKGTISCAIKTVPSTSTAKQRMDFLREASIMKQFDTFHVIKLLGVVSVTTPVYVIMEYMENGDLKEFLRSQREIHQKENKSLVDGIYLMTAQIADGMAYLASKKFVHRDLAARNCMVGENRVVKIGDFGLTRDVYANDYYRRDTQGRLPVRWMAPESLSDNMYTSASDVWSYGIVIWEIVTFSAYPYQGLSNDEVIKRVINGFTLSRPDNCPDNLFNIMERCWRRNARKRPTFNEIIECLLPEVEDKLFPNCFYRKPKVEGDNNIAQSIPEENNVGTESYPLLSWPSSRPNGMTNGVNHVNQSSDTDDKDH